MLTVSKFNFRLSNLTVHYLQLFFFPLKSYSKLSFLIDQKRSTDSLQMFEICKKLCCHMQFSFITHHSPSILLNQTIPVKGMEFTRLINKSHIVQGSSFLALWFSRSITHFYEITLQMTVSRISKTNLEISVEYLQRHFLNHLACFFWNRPLIDRQTFYSGY